MAREIRGVSSDGTLYARLINKAGLWWNGSAFEAYDAASYADYVVAMTEQGASGVYVADFPAAITTGGTYDYFIHLVAGVSAAEGDPVVNTGKIDWTGSESISAAAGSMSGSEFRDYVLRRGFKRTDKDEELYEAVTDAIQELRIRFAFDEAETEATTTDTIDVLGDYKIAAESDLGLLLGVVLEDDDKGTPLVKINKARFDELYPGASLDQFRGYPKHYCAFAGQIYIGPVPDRGSFAYRLSYSKRAGTVLSSTAGVPFTNLYRAMLSDLTTANLYYGLDEDAKGDACRQRFENGFLLATRRERQNAGGGTFVMRPTDC